MKNGLNIKTAGLVLLIFLVILLFASRTIYVYNLPVVTAAMPFEGKLNKIEKSKGLADFENIANLYTDLGGKVEAVHAKDGDIIKKGEPILEMSFDRDELEESLNELEVNLDELKVNLDGINADLSTIGIRTRRNDESIRFLQESQTTPDTVSDYEIKQADADIEIASKEFESTRVLYESGITPKADYDTALNALESLKANRDELKRAYDEALVKQAEGEVIKDKEKQEQIRQYQSDNELLTAEAAQLKLEVTRGELSIRLNTLQREAIERRLAEFTGNEVLYANESGKLLNFDVKAGQLLSDHSLLGGIGVGFRYEIECPLSIDNNFTVIGDECELKNANHSFDGTVSKITLSPNAKLVTVLLESEEVSQGESFDATFKKESAESYVLVPNGTVNTDSSGYFLSQVKRRDGIIGKEFYTQKLRVYTGDNDDENTAITDGLSFFEPVSLYSNKPFTEGQTLYLSNEGDFFEE